MKTMAILTTLLLSSVVVHAESSQLYSTLVMSTLLYHSEGSCKGHTLRFHSAALLVVPKEGTRSELTEIDLYFVADGTYFSKTSTLDLSKCNGDVFCKGASGPSTEGQGTWKLVGEKEIEISGLGTGTIQMPDNSVIGINLTSDKVQSIAVTKYGWITSTISDVSAWGSTVEEFCKANPDFPGTK